MGMQCYQHCHCDTLYFSLQGSTCVLPSTSEASIFLSNAAAMQLPQGNALPYLGLPWEQKDLCVGRKTLLKIALARASQATQM